MTATTMIRASVKSKNILSSLARSYKVSQQKMFDEIMADIQKKEFFNNMNKSFIKLKNNPKEWGIEQEERELTDNTLLN